MRNDYYPQGTVQALLLTDKVTPATRHALTARLEREPVTAPRFFDAGLFSTLNAVCNRLIPQFEPLRRIDLAGWLDDIIAGGKGKGWRYDAMPEDAKAFTIGLYGVNQTSVSMFGREFNLLTSKEQDEILISIQSGAATGLSWKQISARLFFEELLATLVELYYSHPFAKEDIGEVAMADALGWQKIGLNEREVQEPEKLKNNLHA